MNPWLAVAIVGVLVIVLSAFSATKKFAYWIGAVVLIILLLPYWRQGGFKLE